MGRRIFFLCLCLVLGAISTVAVAWAFEFVVPFSQHGDSGQVWENSRSNAWLFVLCPAPGSLWITSMRTKVSPQALQELQHLETTYGRQPETYGVSQELVPRWTGLHEPLGEFSGDGLNQELRGITAHGWPALALWAELRNPPGSTQQYTRQDMQNWTHGGWAVPNWTTSSSRPFLFLPLQPLWPGFALDTAFYAAAWWVVLAAPFALRRLIRRKHGLCGACGYDLRGRGAKHERCPECGAVISRNAAVEN